MTVIIVRHHCPDPGPVEAQCKLGDSPSLVNVTGHGPEEGGILVSVAQTRAARCVAYLKNNHKDPKSLYSLYIQYVKTKRFIITRLYIKSDYIYSLICDFKKLT